MDILSALIFGIIQGATEFLPVSSSAHLALVHIFTGMIGPDGYPGFDVLLHLGTLFAVFAAYGKTLSGVFKGLFTAPYKLIKNKFRTSALDDGERMAVFTVIATLPVVISALCGADKLSDAVSGSPLTIGILLLINGALLIVADLHKQGRTAEYEITPKHGILVGLFQAAAVVPGISRSGATVTGGILCGIRRETAVKLSFVISVPAIIGACILKIPDLAAVPAGPGSAPVYITGCAAAAMTGSAAIKLLKYLSDRSKLRYFSFYCFALGAYTVFRSLRG